jgi:CheY-like chemotaxis protein
MTHALVIDDNLQNLRVLTQLLSKEGVTCSEVQDATLLVTLLPKLPPVDLVFLDLEMPKVDGYAAKSLIRSQFPDAHIVAYTVHVSEINMVRDLGFDGFLGKPLDRARFPEQLARILRGEAVWERA